MPKRGRLEIVDISRKGLSLRSCVAKGTIELKPRTLAAVKTGRIPKGDVLTVAKVAAIMAVRRTSELIPACHNIPIENIDISYTVGARRIEVICKVLAQSKTGVEMEALTGTCVGLLTIWDMVKELEKDEKGQYPSTSLGGIRVVKKVKE